MKWLDNLLNYLHRDCNKKIKELRLKLSEAEISYHELDNFYEMSEKQVKTLKSDIKKLKSQIKTLSATKTKTVKENLARKKIIYNGHRPSSFLKWNSEYVLDFSAGLMVRAKFTSEDDLVKYFVQRFHKAMFKKYISDVDKYNLLEKWDTPDNIIKYFKKEGKLDDCDGFANVMYACLYELLDDYFPDWDKSRLKVFIVNAYPNFGHAVIGWQKATMDDYLVVETSYYNNNFADTWKKEYTFNNNMLYNEIRFAYDKNGEYKLRSV